MSRMELKKTQVGALLKVISKDEARPILTTAKVDKWGDNTVLVATNGYIMAVLNLDAEDAEPIVGKLIKREMIERWYKLATGKSRLDTRELVGLYHDQYGIYDGDVEGEYPNWAGIIPTKPSAESVMSFNAEYAKVLQDLEDNDGLAYTLHGGLKAMIAKTDKGTYVLMPKKV